MGAWLAICAVLLATAADPAAGQEIRPTLDRSGPLRLDLTELRSADRAGVMLLRALHAKGEAFVGASPFIRLLLGIETSRPPPSDGPTPRESKT